MVAINVLSDRTTSPGDRLANRMLVAPNECHPRVRSVLRLRRLRGTTRRRGALRILDPHPFQHPLPGPPHPPLVRSPILRHHACDGARMVHRAVLYLGGRAMRKTTIHVQDAGPGDGPAILGARHEPVVQPPLLDGACRRVARRAESEEAHAEARDVP